MPDRVQGTTAEAGEIWITLTDRQKELLLWQIVSDFGGGELFTIPADDIPGRRLLFHRDGERIGMCATEDYVDG